MPLVVQCFQCQNLLELDEGFRGAICRCSHCGALLEVPAGNSKKTQRARPSSPQSGKPHKSPGGSSVDIGISSGIADPRRYRTATSVLAKGQTPRESPPPASPPAEQIPAPRSAGGNSDRLFLIGIFAVILITLIISAIVFYVLVLSAESHGYWQPLDRVRYLA